MAQKNDWTVLNDLIESRQQLLYQFFSESIARTHAHELEKIRDGIRLILQQDSRTKKISLENKSTLAKGLKKLNTGKALFKLYR